MSLFQQPYGFSYFTGNSYALNATQSSVGYYSRIFAYIAAIIIVIVVILLFVHFFISPIFRLYPGAPGVIPIPGWDDGTLFWDKGISNIIPNTELPISDKYSSYSVSMDIFIENPFQFAKSHRIIFSRGGTYTETPGDTLTSILSRYNLVVALLPDTNDLIVSTLNVNNNMENVIISNVPVQEPFRLTIVMLDNAMEVYVNGQLSKTRTFSNALLPSMGDVQPGLLSNVAKIRNLKIWPRILVTNEVRYIKPSLAEASDFGAGPIPTSTSCPMESNGSSNASASS
jgi:hypothetical protein